ncbi:MAG TPA: hypothetical protein VFO26_14825, partial [Gaiella sp.]|uniref:hypothetical protein n=1 Tax=Gaiella sp. TaxID=2663207 RepID=UPI002D7FF723
LTDAVKRFAALGAQGAVGDCLLELAIVHADEGELMHAGRLWGAGQALLEQSHHRASRHRAITPLPEDALAEGAAMSPEEAVKYAIAPA